MIVSTKRTMKIPKAFREERSILKGAKINWNLSITARCSTNCDPSRKRKINGSVSERVIVKNWDFVKNCRLSTIIRIVMVLKEEWWISRLIRLGVVRWTLMLRRQIFQVDEVLLLLLLCMLPTWPEVLRMWFIEKLHEVEIVVLALILLIRSKIRFPYHYPVILGTIHVIYQYICSCATFKSGILNLFFYFAILTIFFYNIYLIFTPFQQPMSIGPPPTTKKLEQSIQYRVHIKVWKI